MTKNDQKPFQDEGGLSLQTIDIALPRWLQKRRRILVVLLHLLLVIAASYQALSLRFDGDIPAREYLMWLDLLPWILLIRGLVFIPFRLYEGLWRYSSVGDLKNITSAVTLSTVAIYFTSRIGFGFTSYPRSAYFLEAILLIFMAGGIRLIPRFLSGIRKSPALKRVLIFGAGDCGALVVRDMVNSSFYEYQPVGFIDDDESKVGQRIHGIKVLGTRSDLPRIMQNLNPDCVLVAIRHVEPAQIRNLVKALSPYKVPIQTLPNFADVLSGKPTVSQMRNLSIEDLLERAPVNLDPELVAKLIEGKRVLVTGAGGSIGSELCRQILRFRPECLTLYERHENSLYEITNELKNASPGSLVVPVIGDITDRARVDRTFAQYRPHLVFHAAAHKHVPMMELNPLEAIKNNITGTRTMAEIAASHGVERFILISTDKAVNPHSLMGATKRVAELFLQSMSATSSPVFTAVRFGNVLGSSGSVVPLFIEQIKRGGPVTVTHPEMRRYFMLIPEAVTLVLHAATLAQGSDIFVLDMGEQIRILDLAHNLIRLLGFLPEKEIPIAFNGIRPGEKLFEELIGKDEVFESCDIERIRRVKTTIVADRLALNSRIKELEAVAEVADLPQLVAIIRRIVPNYEPEHKPAPVPRVKKLGAAVGDSGLYRG